MAKIVNTAQGYSFNGPDEGEVFTTQDSSGSLFVRKNNKIQATNLEGLGEKLFKPGTLPNTGSNIPNQFASNYSQLTPSQKQNLGKEYLKSQGVDYDSLTPASYNLGDVTRHFGQELQPLSDISLLKSTPKQTGEVITVKPSTTNPQAVDVSSSFFGDQPKAPTIQENLSKVGATKDEAALLAAAQAEGKPVQPGVIQAAEGLRPEPAQATSIPTSAKMTPEQQAEYFRTEGAKPFPLSPAEWLKQKGGTVPATTMTPAQQTEYFRTEGAKARPLSPTDWLQQQTSTAPEAKEVAAGAGNVATAAAAEQARQAEIDRIDQQMNTEAETELATIAKETTPEVRESTKLVEKLVDIFEGKSDAKEETPSLVDTFTEQRQKLGVGELETQLSGLDSKLQKLDADYASTQEKEEGRTVSMTQIGRRQSAIGQEYNRQRRDLIAERDSVARSLDVKYGTINTIVSLTGKDYDTATEEYNTKFNQALTLANAIKGIEDSEKSDAERKVDNARANVQIMTNLLKEGNVTTASLSPSARLEIQKAELAAGFPSGFVEAVTKATGKTEVQFLSGYTAEDGSRVQPVVTKDANGAYSITNIELPKAQTTDTKTKKTKEEDFAKARKFIADNPNASETELQVSLRERTDLSDGDVVALLKERTSKTPPTPENVKSKIVAVLEPLKSSFSRDEAKTQAETQLKSSLKIEGALPKAFSEAIEDALVEVYGRTLGQRIVPGGR